MSREPAARASILPSAFPKNDQLFVLAISDHRSARLLGEAAPCPAPKFNSGRERKVKRRQTLNDLGIGRIKMANAIAHYNSRLFTYISVVCPLRSKLTLTATLEKSNTTQSGCITTNLTCQNKIRTDLQAKECQVHSKNT